MKRIFVCLLLSMCFSYCFSQDNPYAIFGYKPKVEFKDSKEDVYRVKNTDPNSKIKFLEFDFKNHLVKLLTAKDSVIQSITIADNELLRFISPDPSSKKYPELTPYQFASNSPISGVDQDGLEFYYAADGKFLGHRTIDAMGKELPTNISNDVRIAQKVVDNRDFTVYQGIQSLNIQHSDFLKFAATAYGESSVGFRIENKKEVYAIANAMDNYKKTTGKNSKAYAATNGNAMFKAFNSASDLKKNGTFMQTAIAGTINALDGGIDYSNGGTFWAGNDLGSSSEKWAEGLKFTDTKQDLFNLGNNAVPGENYWRNKAGKATKLRGKWDYKWETTAAYSGTNSKGTLYGTTFMTVTPEFKAATGNNGQ